MHDGQLFVLCIIAMVTIGGIIKMSIRARHGLPIEDGGRRNNRRQRFADTDLAAERQIELLSGENQKLVDQISRLEERLRVLERIATDPAERISREIDDLRTRG
ncbi:hypothetical protein [uncultured Sphingomonas sp.]|uniref:hypothetical protein n=1 Tax=uncultured Sphingomonas sp. TaxID=158754 RepID=UPI0035C9C43E